MGIFRRTRSLIGLDIGSDTIKAIEVVGDGQELTVVGFGQIDVTSSEARADALADLVKHCGFRTRRTAIAVSGRSVIVRFLSMVEIPEDNLRNAIRYEADKYIPYDLDDVMLDCQRLENDPESAPTPSPAASQMRVLLVAAKRDLVEDVVSTVREVGLQPRIVDVDAFALANAYRYTTSALEGVAGRVVGLVDIGATKTSINILRGRGSAFSREIYLGGNDFTSAIAKRFGIELYEAEQLKRSPGERSAEVAEAVQNSVEELGHEINLSFDYFENQCDSAIEEAYLSGGGSFLPGLDESLERIFERRTCLWDPLDGLTIREDAVDAELLRAQGPALAVAVGLATRVGEE
ncbi:MAG: type IV pilus assembly protein PilM [Planctomycetota bacterium]